MTDQGPDRGIAFEAVGWTLTGIALAVFAVRIYSRGFLTRSIGSDDFAISFSAALTLTGEIGNSIQVHAGLGRHESSLSLDRYGLDQKWEYVDWLIVFISYFLLRASVMLFVLRLLPPFKKWQQKVIYFALFLNFAVTVIATIMFGLSCIPLQAAWEDGGQQNVPGSRCYPKERLVIVQQVNGILSCVTDFITALVPQFLLFRVKMKPRTKVFLNIIFALGLVTGAMSIGRVATTNTANLTTDTTWRLMPSKWFGMIEEKCGIIFACGPAVRQFFAYHHRTQTFLPSSKRQYPEEDFKRMRARITLRDIFWFQSPHHNHGRVTDARPIARRTASGTHRIADVDVEAAASASVMNRWQSRVRTLFSAKGNTESDHTEAESFQLNYKETRESNSENVIANKYRTWGILSRGGQRNASNATTQRPFLLNDSGTDTGVASEQTSSSPSERNMSLTEILTEPARQR